MNSRWNNDELQLAAKGVRKYGKDFQAIAEMLGTKTESQVRTFYLNYRRKYNLDAVVAEYEQSVRAQQQDGSEDDAADAADTEEIDGNADVIGNLVEAAAGSQSAINDDANVSKQSDDDIMEVSSI